MGLLCSKGNSTLKNVDLFTEGTGKGLTWDQMTKPTCPKVLEYVLPEIEGFK